MSQPRVNGATPTSAVPLRRCPVTHKTTDQEDFEHDFTTPGKIGNLECPFAKMAQNGIHTPNSHQDPIAAEFHQDKVSSVSPSPAPVGVCPIRFLDKHSPEEIAQYFENHKHEIPRSHEVCVKRYQRNEQSIRLLDAKYGSLVNMIQGLGNNHKQYLPERDKQPTADEHGAGSQNEAMERWAENVSKSGVKSNTTQDGDEENDEEQRASHFERPLREIRVGESPSRPWGIPVPIDREIPPSAKVSEENLKQRAAQRQSQQPLTGTKPLTNLTAKADAGNSTKANDDKHELPTHIVFNGPVFIGYTPEDAAKFLQSLNIGSVPATAPQ